MAAGVTTKDKITLVSVGEFDWFNLYQPGQEEIDFLKKKFPFFHHLDLETCLTAKAQGSKLEFTPRYIFFVLHFPCLDNQEERIKVVELDVFLTEKLLITLYHEDFSHISNQFKSALESTKMAERTLGAGPEHLFFRLIRRHITHLTRLLDEVSLKVDEADNQLFSGNEKKLMSQIFKLRRDIIVLKATVVPLVAVFSQLEQKKASQDDSMVEYWGSLTDGLGRLADRAENYKELINGLSSTMESYLTHRTNEIIKILTIFSVTLLPLTFITGAYGMNLAKLPLANHPLSFWLIALGMAGLVLTMVIFFRGKRWL